MKHTVSKRAVCPFYRCETRQVVYCQGLSEGQGFHVACRSTKDALDYKERYCRDAYHRCALAKILEAHYA